MRKLLLFIAVSFSLAGCGGPTYTNIRQSPEFKLSNLTSEGVVVLGTVSVKDKLKQRQRIRFGTLLSDSVKKKNETAHIYSPGEVVDKIGSGNVQAILNEYRNNRQVMAKSLGELRSAFPARYAMVSSINSNRVYKEKSSYKGKTSIYYTLNTRRQMETDIAIFDLSTGKLAWVGRSFRTFTNSETVKENASSDEGLMRVVDSYMTAEKLKRLYPEPYSTRKALRRFYAGFTGDLMESDGRQRKES